MIPRTGLGEDAVEITEILVSVGEQVVAEQPLVLVQSAKVSLEVASEGAGTVSEILVQVGDECAPGTVVVRLAP
jgi:pyruvate dehydrogenase E2 component (dihydrolipoamide acetyltransferase)